MQRAQIYLINHEILEFTLTNQKLDIISKLIIDNATTIMSYFKLALKMEKTFISIQITFFTLQLKKTNIHKKGI